VLGAIGHNLLRWTQLLGLPDTTVRAARTLRRRLLAIPDPRAPRRRLTAAPRPPSPANLSRADFDGDRVCRFPLFID